MDFSKIDILKILKSAIPNKFKDFPPHDFEDFIAQLFIDNGFHVERLPKSGDYGADLITEKNGERTAIQIKRYSGNNKVGIKEGQQVLGAKAYYNCNKCMIITTSSFTPQLEKLAQTTDIMLWDWNKLQKYICDTYLGGKDYYEFFKNTKADESHEKFHLKVSRVDKWPPRTLIYIEITNLTERNIDLGFSLPIYITKDNYQFQATGYLAERFSGGVVYAGARVTPCFIFNYDDLRSVKKGDKIILTLYYDNQSSERIINIEKNFPSPKCFIATAVYGTPFSSEIEILRYWRDNWLSNIYIGRVFIKLYYIISPPIADFIKNKPSLKKCVRGLLNPIIKFLKIKYNR